MTGTLLVAPGSKLDIIVAGSGSASARCARRRLGGSTGGPATPCDCGDGGRSLIWISGEDMLMAEGAGGGEDSSSKKEMENGIHDGGVAAGRGRRWGPEWLHGGFYRHRPCIAARKGILNSSLNCFPISASTYVSIYQCTP